MLSLAEPISAAPRISRP